MKEEAKGKKLPPKIVVGGSAASSTPTKVPSDEILGALLRINNFDSISSIKDESLDIDLSACVTICADTSAMMNGNSLSSTDFWRVLDESAQNPQLDLNGSDDSLSSIIATSSSSLSAAAGCMPKVNGGSGNPVGGGASGTAGVKDEKVNSFSGTFLRPEAPVTCSPSPFKKSRALPAETPHPLQFPAHPQMKSMLSASPVKSAGKPRPISSYMIKLEPQEQEDEKPAAAAASASPFTAGGNADTFTADTSAGAQKEAAGAVAEGPPPEPQYKCVDCGGQVLHGKEEFTAHHSQHHRILYKCGLCERDFEQESGLKKHLKTHRAVDARKDAWKKCPDCGKCLKLGSLWMHRKIHSENKKYGCDICGQKFVQKINLTHHSRVHITEKPYECPECQKRFQERSHLQRHQKYHAQTRSYRCDKCGKMYKTERCLKVHTLVHLEQRPFACNLCDKSFISNSKLKQHSNIHTGNRPFKCNYCPRDFTNFPNWLKHTRRRHKVDHKTGEHLENIPSYCSKKSTKGTKKQQAAAAAATTGAANAAGTAQPPQQTQLMQATSQPANALSSATPLENISNATSNVMQDKLPANAAAATLSGAAIKKPPEKAKPQKIVLLAPLNQPQLTTILTTTTTTTSTSSAAVATTTTKAVKVKRERKQSTPKQVQKAAAALLAASAIKKEAGAEAKPSHSRAKQHQQQQQQHQHHQQLLQQPAATAPFPDLHCLSLTSAEDLIMEQALEMEESGLYHNRTSLAESGDTDNAISADSAAAMCFKIKSEYATDDQADDEFITISGEPNNGNILCPSLESSPFSSPASLEVTSSAAMDRHQAASAIIAPDFITTTATVSAARQTLTVCGGGGNATTTTYYIPANFPLNLQQAQQVRSALGQAPANSLTLHQHTVMQRQSNIYFPMAMTAMPLLQPSQMLPSVETLLAGNSAAAAPTNLLAKGPVNQAAQHNLS